MKHRLFTSDVDIEGWVPDPSPLLYINSCLKFQRLLLKTYEEYMQSVTPFKIDQNKKSKPFNRLSLEPGNIKKVDMQRLSPRFRSQQFFLWEICGETFSPNL